MLVENLEETSLIAERLVYDYVSSVDVDISQFALPQELVRSCRGSHSKYLAAQEEKKKNQTVDEIGKKRKLLQEEM